VSSELLGWMSTVSESVTFRFEVDGESSVATIVTRSGGVFEVHLNKTQFTVVCEQCSTGLASLVINGNREVLNFHVISPSSMEVSSPSKCFTLTNLDLVPPDSHGVQQGGSVTAPMHGQVISLLVKSGQLVEVDERLAVFEAMKMQHEILAPTSGVVRELSAEVGQQMAVGEFMMMIEVASSD